MLLFGWVARSAFIVSRRSLTTLDNVWLAVCFVWSTVCSFEAVKVGEISQFLDTTRLVSRANISMGAVFEQTD